MNLENSLFWVNWPDSHHSKRVAVEMQDRMNSPGYGAERCFDFAMSRASVRGQAGLRKLDAIVSSSCRSFSDRVDCCIARERCGVKQGDPIRSRS
jgi:hypothetical protein